MTVLDLIAVAALALAGLSVVSVALLVARRVFVARRERHRADAEQRLLPFALELVEGERTRMPKLSRDDQVVLAELLGRYSRVLRGDARAHIAALFRGSAALRHELAALRARRAWRRATAAYVLGDMAAPTAIPALLASLGDGSRDVRAAAARSLGRLGAVEAVSPLLEALASRAVPRSVAAQALLELGEPALPELRRLLGADDARVREAATELVGLLGDARDADVVAARLGDPDPSVRAKACRALARVGAARAAAALGPALDDPEPAVRAAAAAALGTLGAVEAVPALLERARHDEFDVAQAAARAVADLDPDALRTAAAAPDAGPYLHEAADVVAA
ncbi:MAG TPA: HEAT repeat domain-containing protein [Gaiellaceae bacterium]|nr:HEAT repeat domain-containing protein [Gaiellaceae bacterium]